MLHSHSLSRIVASAAVALGLALCTAAGAGAGNLGFGPPTLELTAHARIGTVSLTNRATDPVRLEIKVFRWAQLLDGRMQLDPTDDVIVFPQLITIPANDTRRLRVSLTVPPGEVEKTYRIQVTEIPAFSGTTKAPAGSITMLSQLKLPIFYAPHRAQVAGTVQQAGVRHRALTFSVVNTGTVHFQTKHLTVTAFGSNGRVISSTTLDGWYVLPGSQRDYRLPLSNCDDIRAMTIRADAGAHAEQTIDVPADACRP